MATKKKQLPAYKDGGLLKKDNGDNRFLTDLGSAYLNTLMGAIGIDPQLNVDNEFLDKADNVTNNIMGIGTKIGANIVAPGAGGAIAGAAQKGIGAAVGSPEAKAAEMAAQQASPQPLNIDPRFVHLAQGGQLPGMTVDTPQVSVNPQSGAGTDQIETDAQGNPTSISGQKGVAMTDSGEVMWNGYVFSDDMGFADKAKAILKKYEFRLGKDFDKPDRLSKDQMDAELGKLAEKQEASRPIEPQQAPMPGLHEGGGLPPHPHPHSRTHMGLSEPPHVMPEFDYLSLFDLQQDRKKYNNTLEEPITITGQHNPPAALSAGSLNNTEFPQGQLQGQSSSQMPAGYRQSNNMPPFTPIDSGLLQSIVSGMGDYTRQPNPNDMGGGGVRLNPNSPMSTPNNKTPAIDTSQQSMVGQPPPLKTAEESYPLPKQIDVTPTQQASALKRAAFFGSQNAANQTSEQFNSPDLSAGSSDGAGFLSGLADNPAAVSALLQAGLLGTRSIVALSNKRDKVTPSGYTPERISLAEQREEAKKSRNRSAASLRNVSRNNRAAQIAAITALDEGLSDTIGDSLLRERSYNAQAENRARQYNAYARSKSNETNAQEDAARIAFIDSLIASGGNIASGYFRDKQLYGNQDIMLKNLMEANPNITLDEALNIIMRQKQQNKTT